MCSFSCSSDLNFDQANDLKLEPVVEGNLSYFNVAATDFLADDGSEYDLVFDSQDFDIFRDRYLNDYLQKADCYFEITNTINRSFKADIVMLNNDDQVLYTIPFNIPASTAAPIIVSKTEIFENAKLQLLKNTRKLQFALSVKSGQAFTPNTTGNLQLRSSATVYLEIE
ncbi:hypothetical protein ABS764_14565 [Flavobacterium sp. ST-87]|uniref:DUF1735 domain-containing protein n=1 Tax=Flavobacterium plantiphilum TaxID=3163297 RepID=A0ABW8XXM7_9FLAO